MNNTITLNLTSDQVNVILIALTKEPQDVSSIDLINVIQSQLPVSNN